MTSADQLIGQLAGAGAELKDDQRQAIEALVDQGKRVLVVQATGWGKSAVYFVATALLRSRGAGPTLLISPLLALMRDQIANARRIGIRAETINSSNLEEWDGIETRLLAGEVDLLCISPERMAAVGFAREILPRLSAAVGMVVIDECHCISMWGHDFRSDYRRVRDLLEQVGDVPVLACTATANRRVMIDVAEQLGDAPLVLRGSLDRPSLRLSVVELGSAERLAFCDQLLGELEGSGIIYTLTVAETTRVAAFLAGRGHDVVAYSGESDKETRERIEEDLKANRLRAVVATSALGMGFDKPDLAFTIHLGAPSSVIALYQQVGRAGRALPRAEAILLPTSGDRRIWEYFDSTAFPPEALVTRVLDRLREAGGDVVGMADLEHCANLGRGRLESMLKILDVEGAVERVRGGWRSTGAHWAYDAPRYQRVARARRDEQAAVERYLATDGCRMAFLRQELDDIDIAPCGRCDNCTGERRRLTGDTGAARDFLRGQDHVVLPRKAWVRGGPIGLPTGNLSTDLRCEEGRALSAPGDGGWDEAVAEVLTGGALTEEVLAGFFAMLKRWPWPQRPTWVTWVPKAGGTLTEELAGRVAEAGKLALHRSLVRVETRPPQASQANSTHQLANVWGAFAVERSAIEAGPVLVVDDRVHSGWTLTVCGMLLREAGSGPVLPAVLSRQR